MQNKTFDVHLSCIDTQAVCITQFKTKYNAICWKPWSLLFVLLRRLLNTNAISNEQGGGWGVTDENRLNCLCRLCQIFFSRLFLYCVVYIISCFWEKNWKRLNIRDLLPFMIQKQVEILRFRICCGLPIHCSIVSPTMGQLHNCTTRRRQ